MYSGDEKLINNGKEMPFSMLNFWQWGYSNLLHNIIRTACNSIPADFKSKEFPTMTTVSEVVNKK